MKAKVWKLCRQNTETSLFKKKLQMIMMAVDYDNSKLIN